MVGDIMYDAVCVYMEDVYCLGLDLCTQVQGDGMALNLLTSYISYKHARNHDVMVDEKNDGQVEHHFVITS